MAEEKGDTKKSEEQEAAAQRKRNQIILGVTMWISYTVILALANDGINGPLMRTVQGGPGDALAVLIGTLISTPFIVLPGLTALCAKGYGLVALAMVASSVVFIRSTIKKPTKTGKGEKK